MLKPIASVLVSALALAVMPAASAQTKTVAGEMVTSTSKVVAIEQQHRTLTVEEKDGTYTTVVVPDSYERFSNIKVGDTVTVRHYDNVVFRKLNPGEKPSDSGSAGITTTPGTRPGGTVAVQRTITTTITEIDPKEASITFTGPNGWKYSTGVKDKSLLAQVKVGDQVNITWTEAAMIEVVAPKH